MSLLGLFTNIHPKKFPTPILRGALQHYRTKGWLNLNDNDNSTFMTKLHLHVKDANGLNNSALTTMLHLKIKDANGLYNFALTTMLHPHVKDDNGLDKTSGDGNLVFKSSGDLSINIKMSLYQQDFQMTWCYNIASIILYSIIQHP